MCYLVAKKFDKVGSVALKTRHGKELVAFTKDINARISGQNIQLITISKPEAYKEYAPYQIVDTKSEFLNHVVML